MRKFQLGSYVKMEIIDTIHKNYFEVQNILVRLS